LEEMTISRYGQRDDPEYRLDNTANPENQQASSANGCPTGAGERPAVTDSLESLGAIKRVWSKVQIFI